MQLHFNLPMRMPKDAYAFGVRSSGETHGVVLTKPHVVDLILDLAGYTANHDLASAALLEPSCGHGAFLVAAVTRLLEAANRTGRAASMLTGAILAFDIDREHVERTKGTLLKLLLDHNVEPPVAEELVESWVRQDDFLLTPVNRLFDFVVGNPPYIRIEQLPEALQAEYRRRYQSLFDRADLYVAFIERGLTFLSPSGILSFICADRWVANKYGAPLRKLVSASYKVHAYIDLHKASPFESDVVAYPSIFVMSRGKTDSVPVITLATASDDECRRVLPAIGGRATALPAGIVVNRYKTWFEGDEPWILSSAAHLDVLRALEGRYAPIEATAHVGIGVATGNDKVYIVNGDTDLEPDRLVPLVMREDIEKGQIKNAGRSVINVFDDEGGVVELNKYPKLRTYLNEHASDIKRRHIAQKNPGAWFRTIDRVYPSLVSKPKLLIPDIAGSNEVVFEQGHYHPHHNLYFITSDRWDMEVLGGLLSSRTALFFVWSYAVKMRGGYLRFQAQYLRRIRLPDPSSMSTKLRTGIKSAFKKRDFGQLDKLALQAYGLDSLAEFDFVDTRR